MCGIVGFTDSAGRMGASGAADTLSRMMAEIRHRGPDSDGTFEDEAAAVYLGHKRLSIVDLSPAGHQPMVSASGHTVIVYNGELYDTGALREDLLARNIRFRGHSDTEILVEAIEAFGIRPTLARLNGMFAFAVLDKKSGTIHLVRDQIGIKPLFWSFSGGDLVFASELKPFFRHPSIRPAINEDALALFLDRNYIHGTSSILKGVHKLRPGHILTLARNGAPDISPYWLPEDARPVDIPAHDRIAFFDHLLRTCVKDQMVSDVPLGLFLSGGIDSSLVAALMQAEARAPVRTFTIGFEEDGYNESRYAQQVADILGTQHTCTILGMRQALDLIPDLPHIYDEPFADSSQIPMLLLSQVARRDVTVCLSGDGGDELFLGYKRYKNGAGLFARMDRMKGIGPVVRGGLRFMARLPLGGLPGLPENPEMKLLKMAEMVALESTQARYREMVGLWPAGSVPLKSGQRVHRNMDGNNGDPYDLMRLEDMHTYLPDDILQKSDRASMAYGLEARVPLLDLRLVEAALSTPPAAHIEGGTGKSILRKVLGQYVPPHIFDRPKAGFSVPIGEWLRKDLRELAEANFSPAALDEAGYLETAAIRTRWEQHKTGTHNWQHSLWGVMVFQMWRKHYGL